MPKRRLTTRTIALAIGLVAAACQTPPSTIDDRVVGKPEAADASQDVANLWYRISASEETLDVGLRLYAPPARTKFFLPAEWAGQDDYADSIRIAGARTDNGPVDIAIARQSGELEVAAGEDATWVEVRYRVDLEARSDFHPQLDRGVLVAFGPTFLVTPSQQVLERTSQIPIEVWLPDDWQTLSTWPTRGSQPSESRPNTTVHTFVASDVRELRDAFLVAGETLRKQTRGDTSDRIEIAFGPAFEGDPGSFTDSVAETITAYRDRFGSTGPVSAYVRARSATERQLGGLGRRGGFVVDLPPDEALSPQGRLLVAHEALHLWNGHVLLPNSEQEESTRWFKEGVTHYLALKQLASSGTVDEAFVLAELAEVAANYRRNPLRLGAAGQPVDRARFPYDHGVLVALALDAALHDATNGSAELEDWLAELMNAPDRRYSEQQLLSALQEVAGSGGRKAIAAIWRRWVRNREPIPLAKLFDGVDLHWLPPVDERDARLLPLDRDPILFRALLSTEAPP